MNFWNWRIKRKANILEHVSTLCQWFHLAIHFQMFFKIKHFMLEENGKFQLKNLNNLFTANFVANKIELVCNNTRWLHFENMLEMCSNEIWHEPHVYIQQQMNEYKRKKNYCNVEYTHTHTVYISRFVR